MTDIYADVSSEEMDDMYDPQRILMQMLRRGYTLKSFYDTTVRRFFACLYLCNYSFVGSGKTWADAMENLMDEVE